MKIGAVSDTHSKPLPQQMIEDFKDVDFIIHAGDFCSLAVLKELKELKEVKGVWGNMDGPEIREILPRKQIVEAGEIVIGIYHGEGSYLGILDAVVDEFRHDKVDVVVFGHSHQALNERRGETLFFNPGSPTDTIFAPYLSYGVLEVHGKNVEGKIIEIKDN